ncbi:MAG: ferritin-like domain-containing protein [Candidatus Eisenbacteria bacterium]
MPKNSAVVRSPDVTLNLLNRALHLEYSMIVHYPRLANSVGDEDTRRLINELGSASIAHADAVADVIKALGGRPDWSFEPFPSGKDLVTIMRTQLGNEKRALEFHHQAAEATEDASISARFIAMAREEEDHIRTVEKILRNLSATQK